MGIKFKDVFAKVKEITGRVLKQVVVQEASKIPAVEAEVEAQKVVAGKNILWSYFPLMLIGGLVIFSIAKFK